MKPVEAGTWMVLGFVFGSVMLEVGGRIERARERPAKEQRERIETQAERVTATLADIQEAVTVLEASMAQHMGEHDAGAYSLPVAIDPVLVR